MRDYAAGHIATEASRPLVEAIGRTCCPPAYTLYPGVQYRHLLVAKGAADRAEAAVDVRPPHNITDQSIARDLAAMDEIVGIVETTASQVESIATASEEQSATSEEINRAVEEVNGIAGETAAGMVRSSGARA